MNNNIHDYIAQFLSSLKKMPAVKKFYRFPEKRTQEEKLVPHICSEKFNLSLFSQAIKATYNDYMELFFRNEYLWKFVADKEITSDTSDVSYRVKEVINNVDEYWHDLTDMDKAGIVLGHDLMLICLMDQPYDGQISELRNDEYNKTGETISYYRGHSDYAYGVLPTMLRGVKAPQNTIIDYAFVANAYKQASLENRYTKCIGSTMDAYRYCAFMQHSREYSPLLDFTESINIAISFACSNISSYNTYIGKDAAILEIDIPKEQVVRKEEECNRLIQSIDIYVCKDKLTYNSIIRGKPLMYCTKKDFEVIAHLIDLKTNDRMRYQKGCFLLFSKAVITGDDVLIPAGLPTCMKKYIIPKDKKKDLYESIKKNRHEIDVEHLMDPYKFFSEAPIEW